MLPRRSANKFGLILSIFCIFMINMSTVSANQLNSQAQMLKFIEKASGDEIEDYKLKNIDFDSDQPNFYLATVNFLINQKQELVEDQMLREFFLNSSEVRKLFNASPKLPERYNAFDLKLIKERYDNILSSIDFLQQQRLATFSKEVFANNDTNDSHFDLIEDLNNIERLLFGVSSEVLLDGTSEIDQMLSAGMGLSRSGSPSTETSRSDSSQTPDSPQTDDSDSDPGSPDQQTDNQPRVSPEPTECQSDPELEKQLKDFQENQNNDTNNSDQAEDAPSSTNDENRSSGSNQNRNSNTNNTNQDPVANPPSSSLPVLEPFELECEEGAIFCFKKEEVLGRWGLVLPEIKNCVQCQIETFQGFMNQLLAQNLIPKKVTGNIGELPFCKAALAKSVAGFDFTIISKSIRQPYPVEPMTVEELTEIAPKQDKVLTGDKNVPDPTEQQLQKSLDRANRESADLERSIYSIQEGYSLIAGRMDLFNQLLDSLINNINALQRAAENLTKKKKCSDL